MARTRSEKSFGWRVIAAFVLPLLLMLARYRIRNPERIPKSGAFVLAPNHVTNFDPLVTAYLLWKLGRVPRFLAKAGLFDIPIIGGLLRYTGQIPVERQGRGTADPLSAASRLVDDGLAVIVYPEGSLTRDPELWPMRGKFGAARLALAHGIPVIPVAHWGAQQVLPRYSKKLSLFPRKTIELNVGEPVDLSAWEGRAADPSAHAAATAEIMRRVTLLLEELRGETAPAERWDPASKGQSEIGRFDDPA